MGTPFQFDLRNNIFTLYLSSLKSISLHSFVSNFPKLSKPPRERLKHLGRKSSPKGEKSDPKLTN